MDDGEDKGVADVEALQAKASEVRARAEEEGTAAASDLDAKLRDLEERARQSRRGLERAHAQDEAAKPASVESAQGLGVGLTIAYGIIGTPLAGWLVGMAIDRKPNGPVGAALTVIGAAAGVVWAIVVLNRTNKT